MNHLIAASQDRPGDDPIFAINAEAQRRAAAGEHVINASLGALMRDDGRLAVIPAVFEAFGRVDPARAAGYAPIAGDAAFREAIIRDVFGSGRLAEHSVAVATPGGTGAIHHAIVNFLAPGEDLYTTSYFWGPYEIIASHTARGVTTFPMFDGRGRFALEAFEQGLGELVARQQRALVIFNFPCHNPTGYSFDDEEWRRVAAILRRAGEGAPITFLVDLAYARYGASGAGGWVELVEPLLDTCTLLVAWTASKSFTQYGARVGGLIATVADDDERRQVHNALSYSCRGTWSNCNHLGILAVTELLTQPDLAARADEERSELVRLLDDRVRLFKREAGRVGLRIPRYEGGFFVAVFTADAQTTAAACREEGVFVVPMDGAVRVALCSAPTADVPRLAEVLGRGVEAAQ